ncbi:MAG: transposase [Bacteriovoracaceae bacterium]|nr:transposase [Bacteriovoracaceae bacterium]
MIKHVRRNVLKETPIHCILKTDIEFSLQSSHCLKLFKKLVGVVERKYCVTVAQYFVHKSHIHILIITPVEKNLSLAMGYISSMMARDFNKRFKRKGRYWADRFYSSVKISAKEIRRAIYYIANQIKYINPFRCRFCSLGDGKAIPRIVLNRIGVGTSSKKLEDVVLFGKAPYKYNKYRTKKLINKDIQLSFF